MDFNLKSLAPFWFESLTTNGVFPAPFVLSQACPERSRRVEVGTLSRRYSPLVCSSRLLPNACFALLFT